jgi:hypothetical protein
MGLCTPIGVTYTYLWCFNMWGMDGYYDYYDDDKDRPTDKKYCNHEWTGVLLIMSTKWHCTKCGVKKEEWEAEHEKGTL